MATALVRVSRDALKVGQSRSIRRYIGWNGADGIKVKWSITDNNHHEVLRTDTSGKEELEAQAEAWRRRGSLASSSLGTSSASPRWTRSSFAIVSARTSEKWTAVRGACPA
jgi:hypothetical protein